ncbi:hypothetical protein ASE63_25220 [Bosea sp. Root381]|nr:hypothetical protein ASE63_25220 [Bosea sp. Root381]
MDRHPIDDLPGALMDLDSFPPIVAEIDVPTAMIHTNPSEDTLLRRISRLVCHFFDCSSQRIGRWVARVVGQKLPA